MNPLYPWTVAQYLTALASHAASQIAPEWRGLVDLVDTVMSLVIKTQFALDIKRVEVPLE